MLTTGRKLRVFLCHASQDKPIVRELYQRLLAEGWIDPWLDEEKLLPGQDWDMQIENAVAVADAVIVVVSNNSITKEGVVQKEIRRALDKAEEKPEDIIFIIPLRLEDCPIPRRLRIYQYQDFFTDINLAYARLLISLQARAKTLGIDFLALKENFQKQAEEEQRKKREQQLRKEAAEKVRLEEEEIFRKKAEEEARISLQKHIYKIGVDRKEWIPPERDELKYLLRQIDPGYLRENLRILLADEDPELVRLLDELFKILGCKKVDGVNSFEELQSVLVKNKETYLMVITNMFFHVENRGTRINRVKDIIRVVKAHNVLTECVILTAMQLDANEVLTLRDEYDIAYALEMGNLEINKLDYMIYSVIAKNIRRQFKTSK